MSEIMFSLLDGEKPTEKKFVATGIIDGKYVEYLASRTKEILNIYNDVHLTDIIGSIHKNKPATAVSDDDCKIQVAGDWEDFAYIVGVNLKAGEIPPRLVESGLQKSNTQTKLQKSKKLKYKVLSDVKVTYDTHSYGSSVIDFLYQAKSVDEIIEEKQIDMSWTEEKNYRVLTNTMEILQWIEGLDKTDEIVGFDTETTGLLVNSSKKDVIVGICMSYEDNGGVYFPLKHERMQNVDMGEEELIRRLKPYIDKRSKKRKKLVTHNGGFDWKVMHSLDIYLNIVYDTFARFSIMEISNAKFMSGLKAIASRELGIDVIELSDMYKSRTDKDILAVKDAVFNQGLYVNDITKYKLERASKWEDLKYDFRYAPEDFVRIYGSADADFPRLIHKIMDSRWDSELDMIYNIEIGVIPAIGEQEYYGVKAVESEFNRLYEETVTQIKELESEIYALAGHKFDINSPQQKSKVLFEEMGCPVLPRFYTKKGLIGTGGSVLDTLAGYKNKDGTLMYPIVKLLRKHSKLTKLVSSFYGKLPQLIHNEHLYPTYKSMGAETGRFSCANPNLQQTEPTSRSYMIPDNDDYYFLICDYSQVEYRIMSGLSQERKVIDFFANNPEADYHIMAVSNMMNIPYEDVTPKQRKMGKKLNFGTTYGLGDENLALNLYGNTTPFHQMMARQAREQYFAGVPTLRDYFERKRDEAQEKGYAVTMFGRRREIPEFKYKNAPEWKIAGGRRKAGNMPVQGTAADLQKMALTRIYNGFKRRGHFEDEARIVMNIHDEVVMHVHKSLNPWYALMIVREAMEMDLSKFGFPPLYVGGNVGYSWKDGKADDLEAPVLLMDRKVAEVKEFLAQGHTWRDLPTYDDPRTMWLHEIQKFSLQEVEREMTEKNIQDLDHFHKEKRCLKYAMVFNDDNNYENNIFYSIKEHGWEYTFENREAIMQQEIIPYVEQVSHKGEEIPDTEEGINALVRKHLKYSKKYKVLRISLVDADSDFFTVLNEMMVENDALDNFKSEYVPLTLEIEIGSHKPERVKYRKLLSGFIPIVQELLKHHLIGSKIPKFEDKIEEIGTRMLAM